MHLPDDLGEMLRAHIDTFLPDESPDRWLFTVGDGLRHGNDIDWRWGRPGRQPGCHTCGSTAGGTSTPLAASPPAATSLPSSERSGTCPQPPL